MKMMTSVVLVLTLLAFVVAPIMAETGTIVENGNLVLVEKTVIASGVPSNISAEQVMSLVSGQEKEIPIDLRRGSKRDAFSWPGFFYITPVQEYSRVAVYDAAQNKVITLGKSGELYGNEEVAYYIIFLLLAIAAMIVSNVMAKFKKEKFFAVVTAAPFLVLSVFAAPSAIATIVVIAAAVFVAFVKNSNDSQEYESFSAMFYIAAVVALFI